MTTISLTTAINSFYPASIVATRPLFPLIVGLTDQDLDTFEFGFSTRVHRQSTTLMPPDTPMLQHPAIVTSTSSVWLTANLGTSFYVNPGTLFRPNISSEQWHQRHANLHCLCYPIRHRTILLSAQWYISFAGVAPDGRVIPPLHIRDREKISLNRGFLPLP